MTDKQDTPRTKRECLDAVIANLNLDIVVLRTDYNKLRVNAEALRQSSVFWRKQADEEREQAVKSIEKERERRKQAETALHNIREAIAEDRSDGESDFSVGVNAAVRRHIEMFDAIAGQFKE